MKKFFMAVALSLIFSGMAFAETKSFTLTSKSFKNNGAIPTEFTKAAGGDNTSPQLSWFNAPPETKSFVITCIDIHPVAHRWVHWMVINIPEKVSSLEEEASCGSMPKGATELQNSFKLKGWGGPMPPPGTGVHQYVFTIYALKKAGIKPPKQKLSEKALLRLLAGKILAQASITGTYEEK
ncbi:MAG: YbhB/YbcL family Raf kinase inhibitor-like protein [Victivallaceae bacterium]|nr:YbhB/YbcL family Raf kinase inhibitor-like protein [Victivallaceae bacterium]